MVNYNSNKLDQLDVCDVVTPLLDLWDHHRDTVVTVPVRGSIERESGQVERGSGQVERGSGQVERGSGQVERGVDR